MFAHVEIHIRLKLNNSENLHTVLKRFAKQSKGWKWPSKQSRDYQKLHGASASFVICDSITGLERGAVAIANVQPKYPGSFRVTNIVPQDSSSLTMAQYNDIGTAFTKDFRCFLHASRMKGEVQICGPQIGLPEIITGTKCRRFFESWLQTPTPTSHPSDVHALDRFTCAAFRFGAKMNLDRLARYLIEDRKWNADSAAWAMERIQAGLDVLKVNRKF